MSALFKNLEGYCKKEKHYKMFPEEIKNIAAVLDKEKIGHSTYYLVANWATLDNQPQEKNYAP